MLTRGIILSVAIFATIWSIYQEHITIPSCDVVSSSDEPAFVAHPGDLTAAVVSDMLLAGPDASLRSFISEFFLSKFLSKSFELLKPDMLIVLGDVSAKGYKLSRTKWSFVLQQFETILGPYLQLPLHVTLGDRDIGACTKLKPGLVHHVASSFPDLDSAGCGSFKIKNVSFVSLNTVAMLCGNSELLPDVETVIERESAYLRMGTDEEEPIVKSYVNNKDFYEFRWREHSALSQSGPVLLLHFPLQQISKSYCRKRSSFNSILSLLPSLKLQQSWVPAYSGLYDLLHTIPSNATEYVLRALKPRMIFSAHSNEFCDITHPDGTREVTVPGLAWTGKDDPGFVVATFRRNGVVNVTYCTLPSESYIVVAFIAMFALSVLAAFIANLLHLAKMSDRIDD